MTKNKKWVRAARNRRFKAFFFTTLFHVALFAGIASSTDSDIAEYLPDIVKEWFGMEEEALAAHPTP